MKNHFNHWRNHIQKLFEQDCKIPEENEGNDKDSQPQIPKEKMQNFLIYLREMGIQFFKTRVRVDQLRNSQSHLNWNKVQSLIKKGANGLSKGDPIIISQDHVIADGAHRVWALKMIDKNADIAVWEIQIEIGNLITQMKQFLNHDENTLNKDE